VQPPLSGPAGFGHLEVPQVCVIDDQPGLVFSCLSIYQDPARLAGPPDGGVYVVPGEWASQAGQPPVRAPRAAE
jgi:beta-fructofuranosidase